jgi:hypothetical protein
MVTGSVWSSPREESVVPSPHLSPFFPSIIFFLILLKTFHFYYLIYRVVSVGQTLPLKFGFFFCAILLLQGGGGSFRGGRSGGRGPPARRSKYRVLITGRYKTGHHCWYRVIKYLLLVVLPVLAYRADITSINRDLRHDLGCVQNVTYNYTTY